MKNFRSLLVVFLLFTSGMTRAYAQDKVLGIIIELASGEKVECRLVDKPKIAFDGTKVTFTAEGVRIEYTPSDIAKVTMGEVPNVNSGIEEMNVEQGSIQMSDGFVRLSGFKAGEAVRVYSISGVQVAGYQTSSDGSLFINISDLPSGISIIKTNNQSIKIMRR